jgi:hydroxyacylglutathione hydrolase
MSTTAGSGVEVTAIDTPTLGDRSYLAHDGEVAVVVDPQRDIDRVLDLAAARGCGSPTCSRPICTTTT